MLCNSNMCKITGEYSWCSDMLQMNSHPYVVKMLHYMEMTTRHMSWGKAKKNHQMGKFVPKNFAQSFAHSNFCFRFTLCVCCNSSSDSRGCTDSRNLFIVCAIGGTGSRGRESWTENIRPPGIRVTFRGIFRTCNHWPFTWKMTDYQNYSITIDFKCFNPSFFKLFVYKYNEQNTEFVLIKIVYNAIQK